MLHTNVQLQMVGKSVPLTSLFMDMKSEDINSILGQESDPSLFLFFNFVHFCMVPFLAVTMLHAKIKSIFWTDLSNVCNWLPIVYLSIDLHLLIVSQSIEYNFALSAVWLGSFCNFFSYLSYLKLSSKLSISRNLLVSLSRVVCSFLQ